MMYVFGLILFWTLHSWREVHASPEELKIRAEFDDLWINYKKTYNRTFSDGMEETQRRQIWEQNLDYIQKHNREADLGLHTFTLGLNQFTDMTVDEYAAKLLTFRDPVSSRHSKPLVLGESFSDYETVSNTVDWRTRGYVTGVKDQGQCGSCWSFATTGALEGQWFNKTRRLVSLSEQNLIDCSRKYGNMGCDGGLMDYAYQYIKDNKGIDTEISYPYEAREGTCRFQRAKIGASCHGFKSVLRDSELALQRAVAVVGPIAVAIDAGSASFQHYQSGIYNEPNCSTQVNHAVLVVGYGTYGGRDYWLVKNSWGTTWGERGYVRMSRNLRNQCGIASHGVYPVV